MYDFPAQLFCECFFADHFASLALTVANEANEQFDSLNGCDFFNNPQRHTVVEKLVEMCVLMMCSGL